MCCSGGVGKLSTGEECRDIFPDAAAVEIGVPPASTCPEGAILMSVRLHENGIERKCDP